MSRVLIKNSPLRVPNKCATYKNADTPKLIAFQTIKNKLNFTASIYLESN